MFFICCLSRLVKVGRLHAAKFPTMLLFCAGASWIRDTWRKALALHRVSSQQDLAWVPTVSTNSCHLLLMKARMVSIYLHIYIYMHTYMYYSISQKSGSSGREGCDYLPENFRWRPLRFRIRIKAGWQHIQHTLLQIQTEVETAPSNTTIPYMGPLLGASMLTCGRGEASGL